MSFFSELKRRNVFKVGVAYVIVGWLLIQITDIVAPALNLPAWTLTLIIYLVIIGFPLALFLAWAFELTPEGIKPTKRVEPAGSITHVTGQKLNYTIIALLSLAVVFLVIDNYVLNNGTQDSAPGTRPEEITDMISDKGPVTRDITEHSMVEEVQKRVLPNSIAVLPFENLSPDPGNAYFAAGIHDTILNELAKIGDINVISRTAMLRYVNSDKTLAEIAQELNVETVMEGSVQYAEGRVLVTAQLIDPKTNAHLWSQNYDREFAGIFALQAEIAANIAKALEAKLLPAEKAAIEKPMTGSPEAYALYLRAVALVYDQGPFGFGINEALHRYLDEAIEIDPEFARAYALKALDYVSALIRPSKLSAPLSRSDLERLATENANRALAIDPGLGLAYDVLAQIQWFNWKSAEADEYFKKALALSPRDADVLIDYGIFLSSVGRSSEAVTIAKPLLDIDPGRGHYVLSTAHSITGDFNQAIAAIRESVELAPDIPFLSIVLALQLSASGDQAEALRLLRIVDRLWQNDLVEPWLLSESAYAYSRLGQIDDAQRLYARIESMTSDYTVSPGSWAAASMAIGDEEAALRWLNEAVELGRYDEGQVSLHLFKHNLYSDPRLEQPEFVEVRKLLGPK